MRPRRLGMQLALTLAPTLLAGQQADSAAPRTVDPRAWVGEKLEYEVKGGFLTLGVAELHVVGLDTVRGDSAVHLRFVLDGNRFGYRLHDVWDSWIGLADLTSRRFIQDHHEGSKQYQNAYEIFPDSGFYRQAGVDTVAPTSPAPLDDAAFFYFVRTVPLDEGRHEFDRYFKPDRNPVVLEVVGRDTIDVPAGRFDCIVVRPIIKGGGIFREQAEGRMWLTADDRHRVVQIKSKIAFIPLALRLARVTEPGAAADTR